MSYPSFLLCRKKWRTKNMLNMYICIDRNRRLGPNRGADAPLGGAPSAAQ